MTILETILEEVSFIGSRAPLLFQRNRPSSSNGHPVMLYHGYFVNNFYMKETVDYLEQEGFSADAQNYPFWKDLRTVAAQQAEKIDAVCQKKGEKVSLIGHSLGGLVAVSCAQDHPDLIDTVIALGTPFKGTYSAYTQYPVTSCWQMLPQSSYLQEMQEKGFPSEVSFYAIASRYEHIILPWHHALIPEKGNCYNIIVGDKGHASLISAKELIGRILNG
ncbi:MAG: alpha/beta fold hydrolase [Nanoarchaeota archaeon]|nr:alpha/beta fold hydrolase [Nanoarchaeota archaeon]